MDLPAWAETQLTKAQQNWVAAQPQTAWVLAGDRIVACWPDRKPVEVRSDGEAKEIEWMPAGTSLPGGPIYEPFCLVYTSCTPQTFEFHDVGDPERW